MKKQKRVLENLLSETTLYFILRAEEDRLIEQHTAEKK